MSAECRTFDLGGGLEVTQMRKGVPSGRRLSKFRGVTAIRSCLPDTGSSYGGQASGCQFDDVMVLYLCTRNEFSSSNQMQCTCTILYITFQTCELISIDAFTLKSTHYS